MLTSILTPVVHGDHQRPSRRQWLKLAALHSLGAFLAAAMVGGILASVSWAVSFMGWRPLRWAYWGALVITLLYLPRQLGWIRFPPLLQSTRQVPRRWAYDYPRWTTALLFGLGLGSGLYTRIIVPTFYLLLVWPFLIQGFLLPVLIWSIYGLARSCNVWWLAWTATMPDPFSHAVKMTSVLVRRSSWVRRVNAILLLILAVWLLARRYFE